MSTNRFKLKMDKEKVKEIVSHTPVVEENKIETAKCSCTVVVPFLQMYMFIDTHLKDYLFTGLLEL